MTQFAVFNVWEYLKTVDECHAYIRVTDEEYRQLTQKYDDAMKRIHDMQAELEYLRMEANRQ